MNLLHLLGLRPGDSAVRKFIGSLDEDPEVEADEAQAYLEFRGTGLTLMFAENKRLAAVTIYADGEENHQAYGGELPHDLRFEFGADEVHARLGEPTEAAEGGNYPVLGYVAPRDVYWLPEHTLHVQYAKERDRITKITLMTVEDSPGRSE